MRINPETLLFEDLSEMEADGLLRWATNIILKGELSVVITTFIDEWMEVAGLEQSNRLLVCSTVLPQKVLLSLLLNGPENWSPRGAKKKRRTARAAADILGGSGGALDRSGGLSRALEEEDDD